MRFSLRQQALEAIRHRGPDDVGQFDDPFAWLGHRRLSILDTSERGHQPYFSEDQRFVCVYNGEIYNFRSLREELFSAGFSFRSESDTEVLVAAFQHWGNSCVSRLVGMFAFAIWDRRKQMLFLARDRFGEKPLFFHMSESAFTFASEFRALLSIIDLNRIDLDPSALDAYLHYQFVPEKCSLIRGIQKLRPGHTLSIATQRWDAAQERYWDMSATAPSSPEAPLNARERDSIILTALQGSVERTLESDVPIAIALSAGIDSGAIAALARRVAPATHFLAITIGYPGRPRYDERADAARLAQSLQLPLHEVEIQSEDFVRAFPQLVHSLDEPIADIAAFAHSVVPRAASELGYKVLLTGLGGDEVFWGYPWVQDCVRASVLRHTSPFIHRTLATLHQTGRTVSSLLRPLPGSGPMRSKLNFGASLHDPFTPHGHHSVWARQTDFRAAYGLKRLVYAERMRDLPPHNAILAGHDTPTSQDPAADVMRLLAETWLASNSLALSDRTAMAVGVEARSPFLDARLVETLALLRRREQDYSLSQKAWLRSALRGTLPDEVLTRKKQGFRPPSREWMIGVVAEYSEVMFNSHFVREGFLDRAGIESLIRRSDQERDALFFAYKVLLVSLWHSQLMTVSTS